MTVAELPVGVVAVGAISVVLIGQAPLTREMLYELPELHAEDIDQLVAIGRVSDTSRSDNDWWILVADKTTNQVSRIASEYWQDDAGVFHVADKRNALRRRQQAGEAIETKDLEWLARVEESEAECEARLTWILKLPRLVLVEGQ